VIELHTQSTPNGYKISIALEELGLPYEVHAVDFAAGDQKRPEYLAMNRNGRIPVIVDREAGVTLAESGAILLYLADKTGKLLPKDPKGRAIATQGLMFQMSAVGPMMGQAGVFLNYAPERIPFAIGRYQRETRRILEVLDHRLSESAFLGGPEYGIADIATWPWARVHDAVGVSTDGLEHLHRWLALVAARPAVQRGITVPTPERPVAERIATARSLLA
jgi:GSH-dependent disulfide-bond oxidoreductase